MKIRPYDSKDWQRLCEIHDAARRDELAAARLDAAYLPLEATAENEGLHEYALRVAEVNGQVAGFAAFSSDELAWLYVDPALYGKGIGAALIHAALQETGEALSVQVLVGNEAALSLYRKTGFEPVGTAHGRMPGNEGFAVSVVELKHPGVRSRPAGLQRDAA